MKTAWKHEISHNEQPVIGTVNAFVEFDTDRKHYVAETTKSWCVTLYNDYAELEGAWRQMESWGHCTVFQGYDCAASWYDAASSSGTAEPLIAVVSEESGGTVWILPLCISHHKKLKIISFADLGVTDYAAPLIAPEAPSDRGSVMAILKAVFAALPPCDLISFQKLSTKVQGINNPLLYLQGLERFPVGAHGIYISEPWPKLAPKIMQRRMYNTIRQQRKKLEKKGNVAIECYDTPETMKPALERLIAMRDARFKKIDRPEMPLLWKNFYRNLITHERRKLYTAVVTMTVNDEIVAACFGIACGKTYYALLSTFKMGNWERYRPGIQLFDIILTKFAEQTGDGGYFDFSIGDEVYKKRFGSDSRLLYEWMAPRSLKGLPYYTGWRVKSFIRRYPPIFKALQKVLYCFRAVKGKQKN